MILSDNAKHARLAALAGLIDAPGSAEPVLNIRASDNRLLCSLPVPVPCTQLLADGVLTLQPLAESMVVASGNATSAELLDANGQLVARFSVGATGAELNLSNAELFQGALLRIDTLTISE